MTEPGDLRTLPDSLRSSASPGLRRFAVVGVALFLDRVLGEPPAAWHPVVWMGRLTDELQALRRPGSPPLELLWGFYVAGVSVVAWGSLGRAAEQAAGRLPLPLGILGQAWLLKTMLSWKALEDAAGRCAGDLEEGRLEAAREHLSWLVSRDRSDLSAEEAAAAAIESVAENASDSLVAPILSYCMGGLPGAAVYRAINTLDAMVGYHGEYEYAGKGPARLDDLVNYVPARVTAAVLCLATPRRLQAVRVAWQDHGRTESPNAGWPMAACAGALGIRLTKRGHYTVNAAGQNPGPSHVRGATRLLRICALGSVAAAAVLLLPSLRLGGRRSGGPT